MAKGNENVTAGGTADKQQNTGQVINNGGDAANLKEATGKKREELTKEQEKDVKELISGLSDMVTSLFGILMLPNGKLVDFSDKEGRKQLRDTVLVFKTKIEDAINDATLANKGYAEAIGKAIPKKVDAEMVEEDRNRIDWLRRFWKWCIMSIFAVVLISGATFYFSGKKMGSANEKEAFADDLMVSAKQWYEDNNSAMNFGKYLKEHEPTIYKHWHSGRWQRDKALRDFVYRTNKMRGWM